MNRERQLSGVNSYTRELGFNPVDILTATLADPPSTGSTAAWLDLCCGTGRALIQAADQLAHLGLAERANLMGVDLLDAFDPAPAVPSLQLVCAPVLAWTPARSFDLVTCVHGLHYLGDKLTMLTRAARWLTVTGRLVADLDLAASASPTGGRPADAWPHGYVRPASATTPAATASVAPAGSTSTCPTPTSALTTAPARTTPVNQR